MARTTPALVRGIIETDDANIPDLTPFINVANELVTEVCGSVGYSDTRLELIETWLAAHFYAIRDMRREMEKVGRVAEAFQYKLGLNLAVTMYGQQAMILDTKGGLAKLNDQTMKGGKPTIGIHWVGTPEEERDLV